MNSAFDDQAPESEPSQESLGAKASGGFAWMASQAGATKLVGIASQLVLAAILVPQDFGRVALVLTFVAFTSILQSGGVKQVLIHHQATFSDWASSGFWLSLVQGIAAGTLLLLSGPIAVSLYGDPALLALLFVAAAAAPFGALGTVPEARLQIDMRFRFLAASEVIVAVVQAAVAISMAALRFGALSIILAMTAAAAVRAGIFWSAAPISIHRPEIQRWRDLFSQSVFVLIATFAFAVTTQAAVISLGLFSTVAEVGLYYFAYNLSIQAVALFTSRLQVVLLPTLSSIEEDPVRQMTATQRTAGALALMTFPIYALLVVVARPLISLLYADKWVGAIPILVLLSVAMIARSITPPAGVLLLAQGRFRTYMWVHAGSATLFVMLVVPLTAAFGAMGAATAVVVHAYVTLAATWLVVADRRFSDVVGFARTLAFTFTAAAIAAGIAALSQRIVGSTGAGADALRIVIAGVLGLGLYVWVVRKFAIDTVSDVAGQVRSIVRPGR